MTITGGSPGGLAGSAVTERGSADRKGVQTETVVTNNTHDLLVSIDTTLRELLDLLRTVYL